jgi:hypothetical protein
MKVTLVFRNNNGNIIRSTLPLELDEMQAKLVILPAEARYVDVLPVIELEGALKMPGIGAGNG